MLTSYPVITIDGPSCSGKGTLCFHLAKKLKWKLLDSGIFYRTIAFKILKEKIDIKFNKKIILLANNLNIKFKTKKNTILVFLEGKNITEEIRTEHIGKIASLIGTIPKIRDILLIKQRKFRKKPGLIADGRDMGTVVFPDAVIKFFLFASLKERANRRLKQLQNKGFNVRLKNILIDIKKRDDIDKNRLISPLTPAKNALILDSTKLSINEVFKISMEYIKKNKNLK